MENIHAQRSGPRAVGIKIGVLPPDSLNAITDVPGVKVGQISRKEPPNVYTGVTAILPHSENIFQNKVPAAVFIGNGFGKLTGISQVKELGTIETPIILTNTLSVPTAANALISYTLARNQDIRSVNPVVGETNDAALNDISARKITESDVLRAIELADTGTIAEGNHGAGAGTICFGWKGGIGTASRKLPEKLGGYVVGVLVQTNFGGVLNIDGVPIGKELKQYAFNRHLQDTDGSCMIVVATNSPLDTRNLERLAKRAFMGLAKTGGIASNGSGDYVIAFSTYKKNRIPYRAGERVIKLHSLHNDFMSPLFLAAIEATEEAIINSLFAAETVTSNGRTIHSLPIEKILTIMKKYNRLPNE